MRLTQSIPKNIMLQLNSADGSLTALANIFLHYGKDLRAWQMRAVAKEVGVLRLRGVVHAAKHFGFQANTTRCNLKSLIQYHHLLPVLIVWDNNRLVVVEQIENKTITIQDPAYGRQLVELKLFEKLFKNIVVFLTPKNDFFQHPKKMVPNGPSSFIVRLQASSIGEIHSLNTETSKFQSDFGGIIISRPRVVVFAENDVDIVNSIQAAKAENIPVTYRGAGHSCGGQSLSDNGLILLNNADHADYKILEDGFVSVTSRSRWAYLESELNRQDLTVPVLTDNLNTTIGGTLSVGGYGPRSVSSGSQISQVRRLRLFLPNGEVKWCSRYENKNLFEYSLAGLGQVGFIERVELKTTPLPNYIQWYQKECQSSLDLTQQLRIDLQADALPDELIAYQISNGSLQICYGFHKSNIGEQIGPFEANLQMNGFHSKPNGLNMNMSYRQSGDGDMLCPAVDYIVDLEQFPSFLEYIQENINHMKLTPFINGVLILAINKKQESCVFPLEATTFGNKKMKILVGFYPTIPRTDQKIWFSVQTLLKNVLQKCMDLGGRPYLYGWHELDENMRVQIYGDHYKKLQTLRKSLDSQKIFNKGVF